MAREKKYRSVTEVIENAIQKEEDVRAYFSRCAAEVSEPNVKSYLLTIAQHEEDHLNRLKDHLTDIKAQLEVDQAIMESYEHWEDETSCFPKP